MQNWGYTVIPTVSWSLKESYEFCFDGIPTKSIVAVSTMGVKKSKDRIKVWQDGMDAMINKLKPKKILVYGGHIDYDYNGIEVYNFANDTTERMDTWEVEGQALE